MEEFNPVTVMIDTALRIGGLELFKAVIWTAVLGVGLRLTMRD